MFVKSFFENLSFPEAVWVANDQNTVLMCIGNLFFFFFDFNTFVSVCLFGLLYCSHVCLVSHLLLSHVYLANFHFLPDAINGKIVIISRLAMLKPLLFGKGLDIPVTFCGITDLNFLDECDLKVTCKISWKCVYTSFMCFIFLCPKWQKDFA